MSDAEHERLVARTAEGIRPIEACRVPPFDRAVSSRERPSRRDVERTGRLTDSLDFLDAVAALPGAARRRPRGGGRARPLRRSRRPTHVRNIVLLGMGGSGIAGDVLAAVANGVAARCRSRCSSSTARRRSSVRTASCSRCRTRATPRRRCRWPPARCTPVRTSSPSGAAARSPTLVTASGGLHVPCPDGLHAARRARCAGRAAVRHAVPRRAAARGARAARRRAAAARAAARRVRARGRGRRATRRARSPAGSGGRSR